MYVIPSQINGKISTSKIRMKLGACIGPLPPTDTFIPYTVLTPYIVRLQS